MTFSKLNAYAVVICESHSIISRQIDVQCAKGSALISIYHELISHFCQT